MEERYITLKLTLSELAEGHYRSRIDSSPEGASEVNGSDSDFALSAEQIKAWVRQAPGGGAPTPDDLGQIGRTLFDLIFKGLVREKYMQCVTAAGTQARLRIGLAVLPDRLAAVPWEYLHDGKSFLLKRGQLIVRVIDTLPEKPAYFQLIRRLLVVSANPTKDPTQYAPFDAKGHLGELLKRLGPIEPILLEDPTKDALADALRDAKADALYFVGHGQYAETLEGQLVLAGPDGWPSYLDAADLADMIRESSVRFAYLNSCSTAVTGLTNLFAGVAQRLMRDGGVEAVVAMQTDVTQTAGLTIARGFFEEVGRGSSPELALARARKKPDDFHSWGVPVVYTYLGGADDLRQNRLACLFSAEIGKSRYGIVLPTFGMGVQLDGLGEMTSPARGTYLLPATPSAIKVTVKPSKTFIYPGHTHAQDDVGAAIDLLGLLAQIATWDAINFHKEIKQRSGVTHWFLFGSRSNKVVASILRNYSPRFRFRYTPEEWFMDELDENGQVIEPAHTMSAPYRLGYEDFAQQDDMGIIEKITDRESGDVFFILAGFGSRATRGCGWHLAHHWEDLLNEYGGRDFGVILRFPGGLGFNRAVRLAHRGSQPAAT